MAAMLVAVLVAAAAAVVIPESPATRLPRVIAHPARPAPARTGRTWLPTAASLVAAVGLIVTVGGPTGIALAAFAAVAGPRLMGRLETRRSRESREAARRQAPQVADLLASTLASGVPLAVGLRAVADAVDEPSSSHLHRVVAALDLGADAESAWRGCPEDLVPVAQAVARSARTGAPLAVLLRRIADDLCRDRRRMIEVAARSAGVRAVAPLAACFLPAFLLVGVVPVVVSLAGTLL